MDRDFLRHQVDPSHADFTIQFLLDALGPDQLGPKGISGVSRAEAEPLDTAGFISDIYRLRVHFGDDDDGQVPAFSCIFKIPTTRRLNGEVKYDDETYDELVEWCFQVHNAECRFYSEVASRLRAAPLPLPFRLPQLFAARPCPSKECVQGGFLLMEDLCAGGGAVAQVELADGMNRAQLDSTILGLAHYHALCLWLDPALVNSFPMECDLDFVDQKLHILERLLGMEDGRREFGAKEGELAELFRRSGIIQRDQHKLFALAPVLCHGDFWSNNLFFECVDGSQQKAGNKLDAIFDWQVIYSGTGINDLLRVIFVCADPEVRRAHLGEWLAMYTAALNDTLAQLGMAGEGGGDGRERPLGVVHQMAAFHAEYEVCFQLFLLTNVLGGEKKAAKREKLLHRMAALFEDCQKGALFERK